MVCVVRNGLLRPFESTLAQKSTCVRSTNAPFLSLVRIVCVAWIMLFMISAPHSEALVVLQYHHVSDAAPQSTRVSPALFKKHMAFLAQNKFNVIAITALPQLLKKAQKTGTLPDRSVIITFDDGYRSIYEGAWPELKKRGWPFTVFVNSQAHDQKNPAFMSWDQLRELAAGGAVIANHTDSHPYMIRQRSSESHKQWQQRRQQEIEFAQQRIRKEIGSAHMFYAHPYGEYDEALLQQLKQLGYLAFGQQSGPVAANSLPQALPRFPMGGNYGDMNDFQTKVFSMPFPRLQVIVTTESGQPLKQPLLPDNQSRPVLQLISPMLNFADNVKCFASGQGPIPVKYRGGSLQTQAPSPLGKGRSRYNCTAPAGGGRFYWYSQLFIRM